MRAGAGRRTRSRRGTGAATAWGSANCERLRAGAARLRRAARPRRSSGVSVAAIAAIAAMCRGQNLGRAAFPRQEYLLTPLHAGTAFAGDLDLQHFVAQRDIELEGIAVIADVFDDALQDVLPAAAFLSRGDRHVLRADQDDDPASLWRSKSPPPRANGGAAHEHHHAFVAGRLDDLRCQQVRIAQEIG